MDSRVVICEWVVFFRQNGKTIVEAFRIKNRASRAAEIPGCSKFGNRSAVIPGTRMQQIREQKCSDFGNKDAVARMPTAAVCA